MEVVNDYKDYEIIDSSNGEKLERWGSIYLLRPDPQIMWDNGDLEKIYKDNLHSVYYRSGENYKKNTKRRFCIYFRDRW